MTTSFEVFTTIGTKGLFSGREALVSTNVTADGLTNGITTPGRYYIMMPKSKILGRSHNWLIEG